MPDFVCAMTETSCTAPTRHSTVWRLVDDGTGSPGPWQCATCHPPPVDSETDELLLDVEHGEGRPS